MLQNLTLRLPLRPRGADKPTYHCGAQSIPLPVWAVLLTLSPVDLIEEHLILPGRFNRGIETYQEILQGLSPTTNESGELLVLVGRDSGTANGPDPAEGDVPLPSIRNSMFFNRIGRSFVLFTAMTPDKLWSPKATVGFMGYGA
jgi:hypothetical protein